VLQEHGGARSHALEGELNPNAARHAGYFPRAVFFFGFGLPVLAALSAAAFFCFFATMSTPFPCVVAKQQSPVEIFDQT
jgi:hypothetical protein